MSFLNIREIIKKFSIEFRRNIKPLDILYEIRGLSQADLEAVEAKQKNEGNQRGMDELLDCIKRRDISVFFTFLITLERNQYEYISVRVINEYHLENTDGLRKARELYNNPTDTAPPTSQSYQISGTRDSTRDVPYNNTEDSVKAFRTDQPIFRQVTNRSNTERQSPAQCSTKFSSCAFNADDLNRETRLEDVPGKIHEEWCEKLSENWKKLANEVGLKRKEIREMEKNNNSAEMLIDYLDEKENFTIGDLIEHLERCNLQDECNMIKADIGIRQQHQRLGNNISNDMTETSREYNNASTLQRPEYEDVYWYPPRNNLSEGLNKNDASINENDIQDRNVDDHHNTVSHDDSSELVTNESRGDEVRKKDYSEEIKTCNNALLVDKTDIGNNPHKTTGKTNKCCNIASFSDNAGKEEHCAKVENQSPEVGKIVAKVQKERLDQLKRKQQDMSLSNENVEYNNNLPIREKNNEYTVSDEMEKHQPIDAHLSDNLMSPQASRLDVKSLLSSQSDTSMSTDPKEFMDSSSLHSDNMPRQHPMQPETDPDNLHRRKPLLSTASGSSASLPSFGPNIVLYRRSSGSERKTAVDTVTQPPIGRNSNMGVPDDHVVHPSSYTEKENNPVEPNTDSTTESKAYISRYREREIIPENSGGVHSNVDVVHPSHTGNVTIESWTDNANCNVSVVHPSSYIDARLENNVSQTDSGGDKGNGTPVDMNIVCQPSSTENNAAFSEEQLTYVELNCIPEKPRTRHGHDEFSHSENMEARTYVHPDSHQSSNPQQPVLSELSPNFIQPEACQQGRCLSHKQPSNSNIEKVTVDNQNASVELLNTENESSNSKNMTPTVVTKEVDKSSKYTEKNCETNAAELRLACDNQINLNSFRDIQNSIPSTAQRTSMINNTTQDEDGHFEETSLTQRKEPR